MDELSVQEPEMTALFHQRPVAKSPLLSVSLQADGAAPLIWALPWERAYSSVSVPAVGAGVHSCPPFLPLRHMLRA